MSAAWDRVHGAALLLAGAGPVKQRLASAFKTYLADLDIEDLPRELRGEFLALATSLTCVRSAVGAMGVVDATVRKMSDAQAASYATRLIVLYGQLAQTQPAAQRGPALRAIGSSQG
jgi:hypothetical protein